MYRPIFQMALAIVFLVLVAMTTEANSATSPTPSLYPSRKLTITVDNSMRLYIDGTEKAGLVNANDWTKADTVDLPWTARTIAVQGTDHFVVGGILASADDGSILTDSSWKCTNAYHNGWQLADYDDSSWPSAYAIAVHQTSPWRLVPGIKTNAYWIWTPKYQGGDLVVYCRKDIAPSPPPSLCPSRQLTITVDNSMRLYIDGTEKTGLLNANDWTKADTVDLPCTTRAIAVQGTDHGVVGGILASTDDGSILTDSSWKCTNDYHNGWQLVDFDDSSWPSAYAIAIHQTTPWRLVPGIKTNAYWIWTPKYQGGNLVVYCRKDIDDGNSSSNLGSGAVIGFLVAAMCLLLLLLGISIIILICHIRSRRKALKNSRTRHAHKDQSMLDPGCALPVDIPIDADLTREPPPQYTPRADILTSISLSPSPLSTGVHPPPNYSPGPTSTVEMGFSYEAPPKH